jgi:WD40 repeat protein
MRILAAIIFAAVLPGAVRAQDLPDQRPILRIEPGMHTGIIKRIGVDPACTLMVTGSDDKTARLWALPEGGQGTPALLRTLRVPIGEGDEGKVFAVALSPDEKWVAAGGWDAIFATKQYHSVNIFETATGRLVTRLGHLGNVIDHLAFSPDGTRLAATLSGGQGMRLWNTEDWHQIAEDKDYSGGNSYGVAFGAKGVFYTVAYDGAIRRYGAGGGLEAKANAQGGKRPFSIAVHPDGTKIAVGFNDTTAVEVYDSQSLNRLYVADTKGITSGSLNAIAWSANGTRVYAGGRTGRSGPKPLHIWEDGGRGRHSEVLLSQDTIMEFLPCGVGIAAASTDPAFGLIAADGKKSSWQEGVTADMRDKKREGFTLSPNGATVRFGLGATSVLFDLAAFDLRDAPQPVPGFAEPKTSGIAVTDWENTTAPKLSGKAIVLEDFEISRSVAIAPDAARFVLGADWTIRGYRADGSQQWPPKAVPGVAWGVNISRDGRLVVAAYGDGTIRWHRLSDGQELLALFVHTKDKRYVAWTPKGYYAASPGAEDLIGWHVNRDWDHAADFFSASRFRDQFNRPDIVKRVLDDLDEDTAIAEANRLAGAKPAEEIKKILPPIITILSPSEGGIFSDNNLTIRYSVRSPSGLPVSDVTALVDGRPLPGATMKGFIPVNLSSDSEKIFTLSGLPQRDLTLSLVARADEAESTPVSIRLKFQGAAHASAPKGSLYALVVGIGKFKDPQVPGLHWAAKDARDFKAALEQQQGRLYRRVEVKLLPDEDADRAAIVDGLDWLVRQVGKDGEGDVGLLFLSGHGVTNPTGQYYYVPYNARIESVEGTLLPSRSTAVPDTEITDTLAALKGKALFFFDTCHAGLAARSGLDYNKFVNKIGDAGRAVVLASSAGSQLSVEMDELQHGAFTAALLEALAGRAYHYKHGVMTIGELNLYVERRVEELTGGKPVELKPYATSDFDFATVP